MSAEPSFGDVHDDWETGPPDKIQINRISLERAQEAYRRAKGRPNTSASDLLPDEFMESNWVPGVSLWREADSGTVVTELLPPDYDPTHGEITVTASDAPGANVGNANVVAGEGAADALQTGVDPETLSAVTDGPISDRDVEQLTGEGLLVGDDSSADSLLGGAVAAVVLLVAGAAALLGGGE